MSLKTPLQNELNERPRERRTGIEFERSQIELRMGGRDDRRAKDKMNSRKVGAVSGERLGQRQRSVGKIFAAPNVAILVAAFAGRVLMTGTICVRRSSGPSPRGSRVPDRTVIDGGKPGRERKERNGNSDNSTRAFHDVSLVGLNAQTFNLCFYLEGNEQDPFPKSKLFRYCLIDD